MIPRSLPALSPLKPTAVRRRASLVSSVDTALGSEARSQSQSKGSERVLEGEVLERVRHHSERVRRAGESIDGVPFKDHLAVQHYLAVQSGWYQQTGAVLSAYA